MKLSEGFRIIKNRQLFPLGVRTMDMNDMFCSGSPGELGVSHVTCHRPKYRCVFCSVTTTGHRFTTEAIWVTASPPSPSASITQWLSTTVPNALSDLYPGLTDIINNSLSWFEKQWVACYVWIGSPINATGLMSVSGVFFTLRRARSTACSTSER